MTVNTRNVEGISTGASFNSKLAKQNGNANDTFSSIMDLSVSKSDSKLQVSSEQNIEGKKIEKNSNNASLNVDDKKYEKKDCSNIEDSSNSVDNSTKIDETLSSCDSVKGEEITEELDEKINTDEVVLSDEMSLAMVFQMIIQNKYDLTDDELAAILEKTGINLEELADENVLRDLLCEINDISKVDLLVDQDKADFIDMALDEVITLGKEAVVDSKDNEALTPDVVLEFKEYVKLETENNKELKNASLEAFESKNSEIDLENTTFTEEKIPVFDSNNTNNHQSGKKNSSENNENNIVTNLQNAVTDAINTSKAQETTFDTKVEGADVVRQIVEEIKLNNIKEVSSMEIKLNPENLGKVHIAVESKNGVMQAKIIAETEAAQKAIVAGIEVLKENFNNNELKVDSIEVLIAPHSFFEDGQDSTFEQNDNRNSNSADKTRSLGVDGMLEDVPADSAEEMLKETIKNTVSYSI